MATTIDVRGLSCPEPLLQAQAAVRAGVNDMVILSDCPASLERLTEYGTEQGFTVTAQEQNGEFEISLTRS